MLPTSVEVEETLASCSLSPVVVLTDFRKSLKPSVKSPVNRKPKRVRISSPSKDVRSTKGSEVALKIKNEFSSMLAPPKMSSGVPQFKSVKRKRESWDPSVEYEIENIVGYHRDKRSKMWYLVKWKNWSNEYNTFEPIENLTGCHYKLMRFFEISQPKIRDVRRKNTEVTKMLKNRNLYKRLMDKEFRGEDLAAFSREFPEVLRMFETSNLDALENRVRKEYGYILRCLIGMYSHQDPGLMVRGQNYKFFIMLINSRRQQLKKLASVQKLINSREKVDIVIENKVDLEEFPDINYIVDMKPGEGVDLAADPLLGCECLDGCSPKSRCCGKLADSVFAYCSNGKLRTFERIAIYECNSRCRCPPTCPNRVVQRGRQIKLCIFKTKSCGWGVKTLENIPKGTFVCEYVGELIPDSEAVVRDLKYYRAGKSGYLFDLDFFMDLKLDMYCIDATYQGNVARFINHSCDPNLIVYPVWVDSIEPNKHRLAFFARKNIQEGEEIQFDYENLVEAKNADNSKVSYGLSMLSNVKCQCEAEICRNWVFGSK